MPHSDSSARKHSIAFHSSHHYIYNSCCGWVTNLWKTSNWTGSRRAIPADSCLQHSWQRMANPATPPIFLISLLFLMLCGAFTKKKTSGENWHFMNPVANGNFEVGERSADSQLSGFMMRPKVAAKVYVASNKHMPHQYHHFFSYPLTHTVNI